MLKSATTFTISCFLLIFPFLLCAQVSGKVLDEKGEALPYATVYVRNTSNGTVANASGEYQLTVPKGAQELVFQYIGYQTKVEKISVENKPLKINARLEPSDLQLNEVVISSQDPAVRIMREVIAKRSYYKNKVNAFGCDVYIKGFYKLTDAPKKIFGEEIGNMGGVLDTNRSGVLYLSESVSKVYFRTPPVQKKEVMISSKVSGSDNGYSMNRSTFTDFDLYAEKMEIGRDILSPLADNAFNYYTFKWAGSYKDLNGYTVEKIKVIPKRPADPTFSGYLYVVDSWWNLAGADLALTGDAIKQPVLDTIRIQQQFVMLDKPDTWRLLTQVTSFKFAIFGFKVGGFFNSVFSNYDLNPVFEKNFFDREVFKLDKNASESDTSYWAKTRPIPLTAEEQQDYVKKDSLQKIRKSKAYLDSLDRRGNRFKVNNLLFGYTWENSYKHRSISYPAAAKWIQFNTVQGWVLDIQPDWKRDSDERGTRFWRAKGDLNYGFSETKLRSWLSIQRRFESIKYATLELSGGTMVDYFNEARAVVPLINTPYVLFSEHNYLKLYDKSFAKAEWSQILVPGLSLNAAAEWDRRKPLVNHSSYSWRKAEDSRYTPNAPVPALENQREFPAPDMVLLSLELRYKIGQEYSTYPTFRSYSDSKWPDFTLRFRKAIPGIFSADADFDFAQLLIRQSNLSWGLAGYTDWNLGGGMFLNKKSLSFMDLYHPLGNQTIFGTPRTYARSFMLLPYYAYATDQPFAEAHAQHHLQGWLLDKIPLLRKLNWKEVIGASIYYTDKVSSDAAFSGKLPYWELSAGFENIGINAFRLLRVDVAWGFFGKDHYRTGIVIGIDL